ncbi:PD-(D/E)XK nuclease family protein [Butyrivibrio sp. YAB3001]|uniref:PD-(D/E)XK nuclease family protein n=1 Tax=Butyrivibrio sp. YAB3001 TaxID=1520812 RepID=UPI0008F67B84|nr:PD-(D/E)XK nuclease family protein [Butyrivibrio sp. YAB3001]SFC39952.1 ATP-dependent helicase/nuclease subunit B [Butyrivibrio sp. YAB3001]
MLRFCLGASGSGKSTLLFQKIIDSSFKEKDKDFLIIVPDQFTMQTQKDVVKMHPSHAIMNIDILSFGRLSHRIFEEVGLSSFCVLDDVGKSLILRRVADILGDKLPVLGPNMHKPGYIDEVKSTISEFMMYGISDDELSILEDNSKGRGALNSKIKDLRLLYREFDNYIKGKYITTEETLDILCNSIGKSKLISNSVLVFDGFTGFTPIQYRVIEKLLEYSNEVIVSVTMDTKENPYSGEYEEQELFMLSKKTINDLLKLEHRVEQRQMESVGRIPNFPLWVTLRDNSLDYLISDEHVKRLSSNPELAFLEENLFRYNSKKFEDEVKKIEIYEASTPEVEVRQTMIKIADAIRNNGYAYRDIAIVCGTLNEYSGIIDKTAEKFGIPVYIDENQELMLNPFIEYITSALNIAISGYKYEDVFHYMRSGMSSFSEEDTDLLENYVRALGIKGRKQWDDRFSRRMPKHFKSKKKEDDFRDIEIMERLEKMRMAISQGLSPLFEIKKGTALDITEALLQVIEQDDCKGKLDSFRDLFLQNGNRKKAKEFEQVYDKVMALLEQIKTIIGSDEVSLAEYRDILMAGFGEIEVGTIPQDVDRVIVGDIERTRLKEIKLLFFLGVVDGAIPSNSGTGGILSDIDRQFLVDLNTGVELAPTPRQQMYIQRLYLYMNLTKPTDKLFLSYSELGNDGKSKKPAYLVPKLLKMFPKLIVSRPEDGDFESQNICPKDSYGNAAELVRRYALGHMSEKEKENLFALMNVLKDYDVHGSEQNSMLEKLTDAAFTHYENRPLAKLVALSLYGANLENSVSRLELFASCCYAHFVKYGLRLQEREEYDFDRSDLGNVFHEVLEKYTSEMMDKNLDWRTISEKDSEEMLQRALTACVDKYGETVLRSSVRNQFMIDRIHRILLRTVSVLKYQLSKGRFNPAFVEMDFRETGNIDDINVTLTEAEEGHIKEQMALHGRIDRVDLYEDDSHVYVKVIDFKSGKKKFSIASLYYGIQLQLVMYMNVALASQKKISSGKDVIPAAILYYHVDDPITEGKADMEPADINQKVIEELKTTGLVNENADIIQMLDEGLSSKSDVIPVAINKNGSLAASSQTVSYKDYNAITDYVGKKIKEYGKRILNGDIAVNPYEQGERSSCTYCEYRAICGYDEKIPGFSMRKLELNDKDALEAIRSEFEGKEDKT